MVAPAALCDGPATTSPDCGRRGLQITLGALATIPLASGLAGALLGPPVLVAWQHRVTRRARLG